MSDKKSTTSLLEKTVNPDISSTKNTHQDERSQRIDELIKLTEEKLDKASRDYNANKKLLLEVRDLKHEMAGRMRRIGLAAKTEAALEKDATEAIRAVTQYVVDQAKKENHSKDKNHKKSEHDIIPHLSEDPEKDKILPKQTLDPLTKLPPVVPTKNNINSFNTDRPKIKDLTSPFGSTNKLNVNQGTKLRPRFVAPKPLSASELAKSGSRIQKHAPFARKLIGFYPKTVTSLISKGLSIILTDSKKTNTSGRNERGHEIIGNTRIEPPQGLSDNQPHEDQQKPQSAARQPMPGNSSPSNYNTPSPVNELGKMAKHSIEKRFAKMAEQRLALSLLAYQWFWIILLIIFIILLIIFIITNAAYQNNQCKSPSETMSIAITGPATAVAGQALNYSIKVADSSPAQEVTIETIIPAGMSTTPTDITSNWTKMIVSGNTVTWKASENLAPNSLSPPNFTFTLTLKAITPNTNPVVVVKATPVRNGNSGKPVIVLDPGHGGSESVVTDPVSGLIDRESSNTPEREEMFEVAQKIKTQLEAKGYTVILTKQSPLETSSHRKRSDVANNAKANIAVSLHDDHTIGRSFSSFAEVYTQKVGLYREANGKRLTFTDAALAAKSQSYAAIIAQERILAEGHAVPITNANFDSRPGYSSGNIPLVMLFAKVPWVYNEIGASPPGQRLTTAQIDLYAKGIAVGIEKAVPITSGSSGSPNLTTPNCAPPSGNQTGGDILVGNIPPTTNTCSGRYKLTSTFNNFGDPSCTMDKQKVGELLKDPIRGDPANALHWDQIIECESGYNPNAYNPNSTSGRGAYGLFQMNPNGTSSLDSGNVVWSLQTTNAIGYNKKINGSFRYWACR